MIDVIRYVPGSIAHCYGLMAVGLLLRTLKLLLRTLKLLLRTLKLLLWALGTLLGTHRAAPVATNASPLPLLYTPRG